MSETQSDLDMDLALSVCDDSVIKVERWEDGHILTFAGKSQRIAVILGASDLPRLFEKLEPFARDHEDGGKVGAPAGVSNVAG
ncbi:hypothetical protein JOF53_008001 [Crossiella equi]|uniref:Uncharacterized protein n=1 Tax=Crossiella equi TaxID=130796 RepID=A0ABS5ARD0_9PSEU|nr:hypothetical protein [Crossiella equi]MBP2479129.1 hypothetical protein [Crossiella equi]